MKRLRIITIVVLAVAAIALGMRLRSDWLAYRAANDPRNLKLRPMPPAPVADITPAKDYSVVATQNPFHPERNNSVPAPAEAQRISGPPPLVYGSMLLGKERFALMATEQDPKPRKIVEGESLAGYKLAEVRAQSVVLEADGTKSEVMFYNALARLRRDYQKTTAVAAGPAVQSVAAGGGPAATTTTVAAAPAAPANSANPKAEPPAPPGKHYVNTLFGRFLVDDNPQ